MFSSDPRTAKLENVSQSTNVALKLLYIVYTVAYSIKPMHGENRGFKCTSYVKCNSLKDGVSISDKVLV